MYSHSSNTNWKLRLSGLWGRSLCEGSGPCSVLGITPRTLNRARGVVGREVLATKDIAGQPGYRELWDAIYPCMITNAETHDSESGR